MSRKFTIKRILIFIIQLFISGSYFAGMILLTNFIHYQLIWLLLIFIYILNVVTTFIIHAQNRNNQAKFSWLYLVLFVPIFGHVIFFVFGLDLKNKLAKTLDKLPEYKISYYSDIPASIIDSTNPVIQKMILKRKTLMYDANVEIVTEGYEFYKKLIKNLKQATKSIFIVTYIIKNSEIAKEITEILKQKQKEGVEIKWLIDDFGAIGKQRKHINKLIKTNLLKIKIIGKIYYPFINFSSFTRNHQKFFIIDSKKVFSGGNNISDEYASLAPKYGHWIDVNYIIQGPYINSYVLHFFKLWHLIAKEKIENLSYYLTYNTLNPNLINSRALLVTDSPSYSYSTIEDFLLLALSNAKNSIKIATPYFTLTSSLEKLLIVALKTGVQITIYFPGLADKRLVYKTGLNQLNRYIKFGLRVKIYKDHFLHSKMGLIDDEIAWIGTNNLDPRSMFSQYETVDILHGPIVDELRLLFATYDKKSFNWHKVPNIERKYNKIENFFFNWIKTLI